MFFVEKIRFLSIFFFQIQNLERGYTGLFKNKIKGILFLRIFEDIFTKNQYFQKN